MADSGILRAAIAPMARLWRRPAPLTVTDVAGDDEQVARGHFRDGLVKMRGGQSQAALEAFDRALAVLPDFADAIMARAELLDAQGRTEEARVEYQRARRLLADLPPGAADRRYLFRRRGYFAFEIEAYELVRSNVRSKVLPQLAHGNALLVRGRAAEALDSYERALKVKADLGEALALKAEALLALGRFEEAIAIFDGVLTAHPKDVETLNSRGIARMALGRVAEANEDWRRQLELLSPTASAARGCVAMRQANYGAAFHEFGLAAAKEPGNPYWPLYRLSAARLAGVTAEPATDGPERWPGVLLAHHAGRATEDTVMCQATTAGRRAEAAFQLGVLAAGANPAAARRHWREVVDGAPPAMIEFAAASNELARLGS
ncbi:tetratricopeptide repeat protein [Reyranella sp.]|uniref:tetratricopeptide repeat protein n=1 Tax=Reyranella sp. TaxID=1929291 RepID=UPI003BAD2350